MPTQATVVIPTFDHGPTLLYSVGSALAQTVEDIEVFVVGDGVPDVTREIVVEFQSNDERVRFFDNPKAPSRGEVHRNAALKEARGQIICYLSDDDLWLPDHVETMRHLLSDTDFVNALPLYVDERGVLHFYVVDLALPADRELIMSGTNRIPLSCGAHTLEAYRNLPYGWRTTPEGKATDIHMWQQFLADCGCRTASGTRPTVLNFPSPLRHDWSAEQRLAELDRWSAKLAHAAGRGQFVLEAHDALVREYASEMARLRTDLENHRQWVAGLRTQEEQLAAELAARQQRIDEVEAKFAARQQRIDELETTLQPQLQKVRELEAAIANQRHKAQLLEQQLRDIHDSRTWKLLSGLGYIRKALRTRR